MLLHKTSNTCVAHMFTQVQRSEIFFIRIATVHLTCIRVTDSRDAHTPGHLRFHILFTDMHIKTTLARQRCTAHFLKSSTQIAYKHVFWLWLCQDYQLQFNLSLSNQEGICCFIIPYHRLPAFFTFDVTTSHEGKSRTACPLPLSLQLSHNRQLKN